MLEDVRRVSAAPVLTVVNTHQHYDHTFGNAAFAAVGAELVCHEDAAATLPAHAEEVRRSAAAESDPRWAEVAATEVVVPERTFSSALALDLGDRSLELVHPGRGHTGGDLVVRIGDADVVLAGDLLEESGMPAYGEDCWPMEWPLSLDLVLSLVGPDTVVVPGHGAPVDRDFAMDQRASIGVVAETIRDLAGARRTRRAGAGGGRVALPERVPRGRRTPWLRAPPPLAEAAAPAVTAPSLVEERAKRASSKPPGPRLEDRTTVGAPGFETGRGRPSSTGGHDDPPPALLERPNKSGFAGTCDQRTTPAG